MTEQVQSGDSLLRTKLRIPRLRPQLVLRPRLLERLQAGLWCRLTLVCAQAGFGKTTLLAEWARQAGRPVAWITLDEDDNALERFLRYLHTGIQAALPGAGAQAGEILNTSQALQSQVFLSALINSLDEQGVRAILVLDDYHTIHSQAVHAAVEYLVDHLPECLHLVISSRTDPPLPLPRLRAGGEINELRSNDLRFSPQETSEFLTQVMGLQLTGEAVAALETRTEGWIAGLQLAALSMRDRSDTVQFIKSLTGSSRYILDYLAEEVLRRQPEDIQEFLLKTSILDRLCRDLCQAVTGFAESGRLLERLEQANLFIQSLDDDQSWYRYHRLFADLLQYRLKKAWPEQVNALHLRAAAWFENHQLPQEAVEHYLAAEDLAQAAIQVERAGESLLNSGEANQFLSWMDALPARIYCARPRLPLLYTWGLISTGQFERVEPHFQAVEEILKQWHPDPDRTDARNLPESIVGQLLGTRAIVASTQGDLERTIRLSNAALEVMLPEANLYGAVQMGLGVAYRLSGDLSKAALAFSNAAERTKKTGENAVHLTSLFNLGDIQYEQGRLHQAEITFQQGMDMAAGFPLETLPVSGMAFCGLALLNYEWDNLAEALADSQRAVALSDQWGNQNIQVASYAVLGRTKLAIGQPELALEALDKSIELANRRMVTANIQQMLAAYCLETWLATGSVETAWQWLQSHPFDLQESPPYTNYIGLLARARVMVVHGRTWNDIKLLESALDLIAQVMAAVQPVGALTYLLQAQALQAVCLASLQRPEEALTAVQAALSLAQPEGYVRLFVDHGPEMAALLGQFNASRVAPPQLRQYAAGLLAHFPPVSPGQPGVVGRQELPSLAEPLSGRELEVLKLVVAGLNNQEIAVRLTLAPGTVKRHLHNIFGKLDVTTRPQAIARARALQLV